MPGTARHFYWGFDLPYLAIDLPADPRSSKASSRRATKLCSAARSHLRVGTFQYTAANHDEGTLRALADFAIERLDSELKSGGADRYAQFLAKVAERQAKLIAQWMSFGFIHGVMNTDNMTLSGETIDYGPCAFMDAFHPAKVFSSIDHYGRYAWNKQPEIGLWNLSRLAEAMLPLFAEDEAKQIEIAEGALKEYPNIFKAGWTDRMIQKLGLPEGNHDDFINDTLTALMDGKVDFTRFFTALTRLVDGRNVGVVKVDTDPFNRTVGTVFVDDTNVNLAMIEAGHAWWFARYAPYERHLAAAEEDAREQRLGLWSKGDPVPPWQWRRNQRR